MNVKSNDSSKISLNLPLTKSGNKVKISLPSLCNYEDDSDEEEEENLKLKNKTPVQNPTSNDSNQVKKPTTGLLSILPPPKSNLFIKKTDSKVASIPASSGSISKNTNFTDSTKLVPRNLKTKATIDHLAEDDLRAEFYAKKLKKEQEIEASTSKPYVNQPDPIIGQEDPEPEFHDDDEDEDEDDSQEEDEDKPTKKIIIPDLNNVDNETWLKFAGSGKKNKLENIQITDIKVNDIIGDNKSELIKQITSEYKPPSNIDYFAGGSRKKHQITYLAYVAKARDEELKNTWAQSKFNKQQSRQRYGF